MLARKEDGSLLTPDEFSAMSEADMAELVTRSDDADLIAFLSLIARMRAFSWEDRMLLQMIEKSPFTYWASDKAYRVVLWSGKCSEIYHRSLLGKPFPEIMSLFERSNAMIDSLRVIEADSNTLPKLIADYANYYTKDLQGEARDFGLITNSMQLIDDETGEKFYAEIGLPFEFERQLSEYEERQKKLAEKVDRFESNVSRHRARFGEMISNYLTAIAVNKSITAHKRKELRDFIECREAEISGNLDKYSAALDFDKFLRQNEAAIDEAILEVNQAIESATNETPQQAVAIPPNGFETLEKDIDQMSEIIMKTFDAAIEEATKVVVDTALEQQRIKKLKSLQDTRDAFLRDLTEMKESIPSSTTVILKGLRMQVDAMHENMRNSISKINGEEETKNGNKKK